MKMHSAVLLPVLLSACGHTPPIGKPELSANLTSLEGSAPLACGYEKTVIEAGKESKSAWNFWRWPDRTETRDGLSRQGEIWRKDTAGRLFYTRLFFPERVALEYMPGDLAATGMTPSWEQLDAGLLDPRQLGSKLALLSKKKDSGVELEQYSGVPEGVATEVDWLPALRLPARIAKRFPEREVVLALKECAPLDQAKLPPVTLHDLDAFRHLDFSDLGDMESDPAVQRILALTGGHDHDH